MRENKITAHRSLPGPDDIRRVELPNGITLLTRSNFNSPSIYVSGYLAAGSMVDPPEKLGLAGYTAACLMRGTEQDNFQAIYERLESAGASLGFGASVHNVNFGGRALAEDLPLLLNLLSETLRRPTFPLEHVERLRPADHQRSGIWSGGQGPGVAGGVPPSRKRQLALSQQGRRVVRIHRRRPGY